MTTDTPNTANLPPCSRRQIARFRTGCIIKCKPPAWARTLPPAEFISDPYHFKPRLVVVAECLACQMCEHEAKNPDLAPPAIILKPPEIQPNGVIVYEPTTFEPPPLPDGYRRKSNDPRHPDAWVLIPEVEPCKHVIYEVRESNDGCKCRKVSRFCTHNGTRVALTGSSCANCPNKELS